MTATPHSPDAHPIYLAGRWVDSTVPLDVHDPAHPGRLAGSTFLATEAQYEEAVEAAVRGFEKMRVLPTFERARALRAISAASSSSASRPRMAAWTLARTGSQPSSSTTAAAWCAKLQCSCMVPPSAVS